MVDANEPSSPRRRRDTSSVMAGAPVPQPMSISAAIEHERGELMQVHAMLKCLYEVLLYADDDDSVMHADVANVCARLLAECVARLDAVRLHAICDPQDDDTTPPVPPQVREAAPVYLC